MLIGADQLVPVDAADEACVSDPYAHACSSVVLRVAGLACAVHFDDALARNHFAIRYADLIAADAQPLQHAFAFRTTPLGPLFWWLGGPVLGWPHGDLAPDLIAFLADAVALTGFFATRGDGVLSLHAAVVGTGGVAAAIVGETNVGKTTTAIACARIGMQLYSDERCVVDANGFVLPFPRALGIRAPGRELLRRDQVDGGDATGGGLYERDAAEPDTVRFRDLFPKWVSPDPAPLRAVFVLAGTAPHPVLAAAPASRAVGSTIRWTQGAGDGLDKVARLYALFRGTACFTLLLGSPDASARVIRDALTSASAELGKSA